MRSGLQLAWFFFSPSVTAVLPTAKTHDRNDMGDDTYTDEHLIAAMLANGLLSNSAKETTTRSQGTPAQAAVAIYFECLDALRLEREKRAQG